MVHTPSKRYLSRISLGMAIVSLIPFPSAFAYPVPHPLVVQEPAPSPATPPPNRTRPGGSLTMPAPPSTPPPNRTRSGGSLSGTTCNRNEPLVALLPVENPVLTTTAHPTVLVYVPYAAHEIRQGEFSMLVGLDERIRLYQTRFTLPQTPGIVSITLPPSETYALQENVPHHWYVKLYCAENTTDRADLTVDGWVQRVPATADRMQQIQAATPDIWYDALAQLHDRLQVAPQDNNLRQQWANLLEFIGAADLAEVSLPGSVQSIAED